MHIDFHAHLYPEAYLERLEVSRGDVRMETNAKGEKIILSMGARVGPVTESFFDADYRIDLMQQHRVDMQILSTPHPGIDRFSPAESLEMARLINDGLAEVSRKHPRHFRGLASLPLIDMPSSMRELERAVHELGMVGVAILTNVAGRSPADPEFYPLYARLQELRLPLFMHPTVPAGVEVMREYRLAVILGFEFDLTLAPTKMAYSGVFERFPELKLVVSHLGAGIPFFIERIDRGYRDPLCGVTTPKPPSEYLRKLYCDTVCFAKEPLEFACRFYGADHLVMGSDFPLLIGDLPMAVPSIEMMEISAADKALILGGNVQRMLRLGL